MAERAWPRRKRVVGALLLALLVLAVLLARPAGRHLRAASLLLRFADANATGLVAGFGRHAIDESDTTVSTPRGEVKARLYTPRDLPGAPGVVIVHGVHRLGIDEPRLTRFARAISATGLQVLTPEVAEIADYRIDPASIETIGASAKSLHERGGGRGVGVMGMSFAGGLSLLAATDPRFAPDIGFVVAIGAQHDMGRVLRFFATNEVEWPDGTKRPLAAHPYGALVLIYSHLERVVSAEEAPIARDAIRLWLWEQTEEARARLEELPPATREKILALCEGKGDVPALVTAIARDEAAAKAVSPAGHLGALRAPVFLLHGAGDSVIPAAETRWLAREVPPHLLRASLVSDALVHVELQGEPGIFDRWELVHFMAEILAVTESP